ncbi:hypothetical protein F5141DRAFT_1066926 [Pisolithus sp. B1]|nr:hypothetical protein F5141DRAFT_1066926 [Pisolithus sp. B1]
MAKPIATYSALHGTIPAAITKQEQNKLSILGLCCRAMRNTDCIVGSAHLHALPLHSYASYYATFPFTKAYHTSFVSKSPESKNLTTQKCCRHPVPARLLFGGGGSSTSMAKPSGRSLLSSSALIFSMNIALDSHPLYGPQVDRAKNRYVCRVSTVGNFLTVTSDEWPSWTAIHVGHLVWTISHVVTTN